jgi:hypothetical protein
MNKKIYLAIPFSGIEDDSFKSANEVASLLIKDGYFIFSPISHSYPIWKTEMVEHTYEVWLDQDKVFVDWADEVWIINIITNKFNGLSKIEDSKGCQIEINWAKEQNKPIKVIDYNLETKQLTYGERVSVGS